MPLSRQWQWRTVVRNHCRDTWRPAQKDIYRAGVTYKVYPIMCGLPGLLRAYLWTGLRAINSSFLMALGENEARRGGRVLREVLRRGENGLSA